MFDLASSGREGSGLSGSQRQRVVACLAGVAGLLILVEYTIVPAVVGGANLPVQQGVELPAFVWLTGILWVATSVLVIVAGGWLALRTPDVGLGVLGVAAVSWLPAGVWVLRDFLDGTGLMMQVPTAVAAALLVVSVALLLGVRDPDSWRWDRPAPVPFVVVAVVAVVFSHQALGLPLGELWRMQALGDLVLMLSLSGPAVLAAAALGAARLPRQLGGAVLLAAFVPTVAAALMQASTSLVVVDGQSASAFGVLEWVGVTAQVVVIALAVRWVGSSDAGNVPLDRQAGTRAVTD